jgi:polyphosphate kinase
VVWPVEQPDLKQRLIREVLGTLMADNVKSRELLPDGSYRRIPVEPNQPRIRSQERFLEIAAQNASRRLIETPSPPPYIEERPASRRRPRKRQIT